MADLIDRAPMLEFLDLQHDDKDMLVAQYNPDWIYSWLECQPTVDAVEVVRCGECKHWNKDALACGTLSWVDSCEHANWYETDYCSYGERRTENRCD